MDTSVLAMLRGSQCESVPCEHDLQGLHVSKSLVETCTTFLAFMVDTQDYVSQMKSTYLKDLWPKVCAELTDSKTRVIELERELAVLTKEKGDSRRYFMQELEILRMAREDERSRCVREIDSLQQERCEIRGNSERGSRETLPNASTSFELVCSELEKQNQLLQVRIEACDRSNVELNTSNEDLKRQIQNMADEIERLKKSAELATVKKQWREKQRFLQEDSADRYIRERRLSLRKQRKSACPVVPWKGEVGDGGMLGLQALCNEREVQSLPDIQTDIEEPKNQEDTTTPVLKFPASAPKNIRYLAPGIKRIDLEADAAANGQLLDHSGDSGHESEEILLRPKSQKSAEGDASTHQHSNALKSDRSRGAEHAHGMESRQGSLESDKTSKGASLGVAEAEQPNNSPVSFAAYKKDVSAIQIKIEPLELVPSPATDAKQPSTLASCDRGVNEQHSGGNEPSGYAGVNSRANGEPAPSTSAKQCLSEGRGLKQRQKTSVSDVSKNPSEHQSGATSTRNTTGKKSKERKWRQTRSRTEAGGDGDLHDSFLDTQRDLAIANLKAHGQPSKIMHEDSLKSLSSKRPRPSRNKGPTSIHASISRSRGREEVESAYGWTDGIEGKGQQFVGSRATAGKSTRATEGAENVEKVSRQSSGARTSSSDKEKQVPNSNFPGYKFNEPVRKKRDREQLEATDCLQCRKFYDAVLAEDAEGVTMSRCEHHDAVSRHRPVLEMNMRLKKEAEIQTKLKVLVRQRGEKMLNSIKGHVTTELTKDSEIMCRQSKYLVYRKPED